MKVDVVSNRFNPVPRKRTAIYQIFARYWLPSFIGGFIVAPLLGIGFEWQLHDGRVHQTWCGEVTEQIKEGGAQPRWLSGMNGGVGSPAMFFYPTLPYAVPVLGRVAGSDAGHSLALGVLGAMAVAGLGMRALLRQFVRPGAALAGALLYVTAPYYLGTDLYVRGAYAEYWAFAWMPLVLLGVSKLRRACDSVALNRKGDIPVASSPSGATGMSPFHLPGGVLLLAAGYGALVATHLPTTLVFSLVPLAFATVPTNGRWSELSWPRLRPLVFTIIGMTLGIGLAAPYLIPAMTMQDYVSMEALTSFHKYNHNFFFGELGWGRFDLGHEFKQTLYLPFLAAAIMGLMGFLLTRGASRKVGQNLLTSAATNQLGTLRIVWFFVAVLGASIFMMLPLSDFVWRLFPRLQIIQFPWRICSVLTVAATVLAALGLDSLRTPLTGQCLLLVYFMGLGAVGGLAYTGEAMWSFVENAPKESLATNGYHLEVPEYRPRWAVQPIRETIDAVRKTPAEVEQETGSINGIAWVSLANNSADPLIGARFVHGAGDVSIKEWRSRHVALETSNKSASTIQVSQLYFPGWTARSGGRALVLRPSVPEGLIEIELPPGTHEIEIILEALSPEKVGNRVGFASASLWVVLLAWMPIRHKLQTRRVVAGSGVPA